MAKWFHPEVNGLVDVFPADEQAEETLRSLGMYPAEEATEVSDGAEAPTQESTEGQEVQSSSAESVAPITIVEMTKAQLIEALRALGETANATMSKDALTEKFQKAQAQE